VLRDLLLAPAEPDEGRLPVLAAGEVHGPQGLDDLLLKPRRAVAPQADGPVAEEQGGAGVAGDLLSVTGPRSNVTGCGYGAAGRPTQEIGGHGSPVAATATMTDDAGGDLLSEATGQSTTLSRAHPPATSHGYGPVSRVNQEIDGHGAAAASTATVAYGAASNLLSETTAQSATATYAHPSTAGYGCDALNRQARQTDGYGTAVASTTTLLSDAAGNLLSQATGRSATFTYAHPETTGYAYGALNRRTQTALAFGVAGQQRTEALAYDAAGNLLADTPPSGHPPHLRPPRDHQPVHPDPGPPGAVARPRAGVPPDACPDRSSRPAVPLKVGGAVRPAPAGAGTAGLRAGTAPGRGRPGAPRGRCGRRRG
jgi:hypothetical protein